MSERKPEDLVASIQARLANQARKLRRPFAEILQYYGMERFLYRLSKTRYSDDLILKGGLVFYTWDLPLRRPTRDIDFLGLLSGRSEEIRQVITSAVSVPAPDDAVRFDLGTLIIEETQVDADRRGIRARFVGFLGRSQIPIRIDFGFSDEIIGDAGLGSFPILLDGMPSPQLKSYPVEAVVAEKFHAMQRFADTPSRWKDYYDIWLISESFQLEEQSVRGAIVATFDNRRTSLPTDRPACLQPDLASRHQKDWKDFIDQYDMGSRGVNDLGKVVDLIWNFLEWPLEGIHSPDQQRRPRRWDPRTHKWA